MFILVIYHCEMKKEIDIPPAVAMASVLHSITSARFCLEDKSLQLCITNSCLSST